MKDGGLAEGPGKKKPRGDNLITRQHQRLEAAADGATKASM